MEKFDFDKTRPADAAPAPKYTADDWSRAADALDREGTRLQGLALAARMTRDVASLEQSAREAGERAAAANAQADSITTELAGMRAELERRRAEANAEIEGRKEAAAASAEQALVDVQKRCDDMIAKAEAAAGTETVAAAAKVYEAQRLAAEATTQRDAMKAETANLAERSKQASDELAKLNDQIETARETVRRLLGT